MTLEAPIARVALRADETATVHELYVLHAQALRSVLLQLTWFECDVDDLLQEVFVVALGRPDALFAARSARAWLYGIAVKVASAARRRRMVRTFLGLDAVSELASGSPGPDSPLDAHRQVHRALGQLSGTKRSVLVLFELEGLSGPEIAEALGCPLKTVWTRLHHARKALEAALRVEEGSRHG